MFLDEHVAAKIFEMKRFWDETAFWMKVCSTCGSGPLGRRLALPCLVHDHVVERAVEDGPGECGARLRLDAALKAAENGNVAGMQAGRAVRRDEAQYDVRELRLRDGQVSLAGVHVGSVPEEDPRLSFLARVQHVVQSGREL